MNLKEAYRYQTFLTNMMLTACSSVSDRDHAYNVTRKHLRSKANPEAEDVEETVDNGVFFPNDDVILLMESLIEEKYKLAKAINDAKSALDIDVDASIDSNKFRQKIASSISRMLSYQSSSNKIKGSDYKFNVEGNQVLYYYDVETDYKEAYDREYAKSLWRRITEESDEISSAVDAAMINTVVDYDPPYNVNDSFEDMMEQFIKQEADI